MSVATAASRSGPPGGTIVVASYNRADRLVTTLDRLLALPEHWPVIVVDDASTDDTVDRLGPRLGDRLRLITLSHNRGAAARNVGVAAATTRFVAFADDDSWWEPGALRRAAAVLAAHPEIGLVAATVVVEPDGRPDPIVRALAGSPLPPTRAGPSVLGFLACGAVVRRTAFLATGGFHPLLHVGGEEQLLAIDLRRRGWSLAHVPDCVAHHAPESGDAGRTDRAARMLRNRALVGVMRRRRPTCWSELTGLGRAARRDAVARRALADTLRCMPAALAQRRPVPVALEAELRLLAAAAS